MDPQQISGSRRGLWWEEGAGRDSELRTLLLPGARIDSNSSNPAVSPVSQPCLTAVEELRSEGGCQVLRPARRVSAGFPTHGLAVGFTLSLPTVSVGTTAIEQNTVPMAHIQKHFNKKDLCGFFYNRILV